MPREKLTAICQFGGEFVTNDGGCVSYVGGEAHALDISRDTLFDDLKLKLAGMCNFEYNSLSLKFFLPGNNRTLSTISNIKDLKRMCDFFGDGITADLFIMGKEGFDHESHCVSDSRGSGIKQAENVTATMQSQITAATNVAAGSPPLSAGSTHKVAGATVTTCHHHVSSSSSARAVTATSPSATGAVPFITSICLHNCAVTNNLSAAFKPTDEVASPAHDPINFDMNATPADTVKKRRRSVSWKIGCNGPTIAADADIDTGIDEETRTTSRKRNIWNCDIFAGAGESEKQPEVTDSMSWMEDVGSKDVPLEEIISSWKVGITGVGQDFKDVAEFRNVLQKYAMANRFMYKFKKNDTIRASGMCVVEGCSWKIHASWVPSKVVFRIKKMNKMHSCGGESWKAAHPAKNLLVSIIKDRLRDSPHQKSKEIANGIFRDFGLHLNYSQVWRGIEEMQRCKFRVHIRRHTISYLGFARRLWMQILLVLQNSALTKGTDSGGFLCPFMPQYTVSRMVIAPLFFLIPLH